MSPPAMLAVPMLAWRSRPFGLRTAVIAGNPPSHVLQPDAANAIPSPMKSLRLIFIFISLFLVIFKVPSLSDT